MRRTAQAQARLPDRQAAQQPAEGGRENAAETSNWMSIQSPGAAIQRALSEQLLRSPRMALQRRQMESIVGASKAPIQAVWQDSSTAKVMQWDKPITGIRWFYNTEDETYFYRIDPGEYWYSDEDPIRRGENQPHRYDQWQDAGAERVAGIRARVQNYEKTGLKRAIGGKEQTFVDDDLPKKFDFDNSGKKATTHFYNTYSPDAAIMRENYRSPELGKSFFASDVFFSQLAAVCAQEKYSKDMIRDLPPAPPAKIVRDTIDNADTKRVLQTVNPEQDAETILLPSQPSFGQVLQTPNGKATFNLLNDFNFINRYRELPAYSISQMIIKKSGSDPATGWKIELHLAPG